VSFLLLLLVAAIVKFVISDLFAGLPWVAQQIVRLAARLLPEGDRARWEAEWLAETQAVPGRGVLALIFATSVLLRAPATRAALQPDAPKLRSLAGQRVFDVAFSAWALLALLPILGLAALLVRTSSPGPILYASIRRGAHGREFRYLKFRTMAVATSDGLGNVEVTRVGRLLRRYSIDEMPQLINVLRGDMSFVGPARFRWDDRERVAKPGVVSWTSVLRTEEGSRRDAEMARSWTLRETLRLLGRTVLVVFRRRPPR
jgi:lipopolysaccharide/colanic/teichoic acid biosynthesis glycosyltransferase